MRHQVPPDAATYSLLLKACTKESPPNLKQGQRIYEYYLKTGVPERQHVVLTAFMFLLGKCGDVKRARKVFDEMKQKKMNMDQSVWTAMISIYIDSGQPKEGLSLYPDMLKGKRFIL
jgi:pentatricopeptide repeat protein